MSDKVTVIACGPSSATCECHCPESCGHKWDGPMVGVQCFDYKGEPYMGGQSVTCSKCGMTAIDHDMWVMP